MKSKPTPFAPALVLSVVSATSVSAASLYWKTNTAATWDSATWASTPGGSYDQPWVQGSDVVFEDNAGAALTIKGPAVSIDFASIAANENVTVTPAGVLGTSGTVAIVDVASGKNLDFAAQNLSTVVGTGFIKNGAGTWTLANGNTYPGGFTLNAGTVAVGSANALGAGSSLTLNGGTLRSNNATARNLSGKYTTGITIGGDLILGDVVNNGALTFSDNTALGASTRTLTVNSLVTHNGIISGGAGVGIIKTGPGVLALGGANSYLGTTTISNGVLSVATTGSLPGFGTNGAFSVARGAGLAVGNAITDANITTLLGTTNFAAGSAIGFDTTAGVRTYAAVLGDTAQGSLGLAKVGTNALTLSNANTYTGGTTIGQANDSVGITVANASALGSGPVLANGTQQFNATVSVNTGLTVTNALTLKRGYGASNRAVLGLAASSTWGGNITVDNTNAPGLAVISGNGTNTATASIVSGNIGFSTLGTPSSASPTLVLRSNHGKVTGSISLSTGYLQTLDACKWEISNASNTWGTLDISHASGIITVGITNTLSPTGVVGSTVGGTLQLNNQAATTPYSQSIAGLSGNVKVGFAAGVTGDVTLTLNNSTDQTSSGVISGGVSLVKSGPAKQTLNGINTYTGSTTVNGGTLALGATGELPVRDLTISSATLDLRKGAVPRTQFVNNLSLSGATLDIGLSAAPDQIDALAATVSGTNTLKLHGSVPAGSYNILTTQAPLSGTFVLDTSDVTQSGFPTSYSGAIDGNNYVLTVTGALTPFTAYWRGDVSAIWKDAIGAPNDSNWADSSSGNNDTKQIPGPTTDVFFSAANAATTNTTLGGDISINSLNFETGTATVGGANVLTILSPFGNGLDVQPGAHGILNTGSIVCTSPSMVQEGGTLTVNGGGLGAGPLIVDGTLNLNMNITKEYLGGLPTGTISRNIEGASVLTISGTTNSIYEGAINAGVGSLSLIKAGSSTLTLAGTSNFSGGTTIAGGILRAESSSALGTGTVAINGGMRLSLGEGVVVPNAITIGANSSPQGAGMLEASSSVTGTATLEGPVNITSSPAGGGHFINVGSGTFDVKSVITSTVPVIHRSGTVTYWGGGTGYTAMSVTGTVRVGADNGLATSSTVTLGASGAATLDLAGHNQSLAGVIKFAPTTAATIGNSSTTADSVLSTTATGTFDGVITNILGEGTRKIGLAVTGGALTLGGVNTYTGDTTVGAGASLILADNARLKFGIADTSGVNNSLTGPGTVTLDGDFNIDTTLVDASALTSGTWTLENSPSLPGAYGASFQVTSDATVWTPVGDVWTKTVGSKAYSFDENSGVLTLSTVTGGFNPWVASKGLTGGDAAFDADPDKDGLTNGLEFVLGGEPNPANPGANSATLLPASAQSAGNLVFSFKRKDLSESGASLIFQWSTNLSFPSPANDVPVGAADSTTDTITVDVTEDAPDADTDSIIITIPSAKAAGGKLFGRLKAVQAP